MERAIAVWWIATICTNAPDSNRLNGMQPRPTRIRHLVLWLTVAAYMITYMDRVVISSAAPKIREEFGFSLETMGLIRNGEIWLALGNIASHTVLGLVAVWLGYSTASVFWK